MMITRKLSQVMLVCGLALVVLVYAALVGGIGSVLPLGGGASGVAGEDGGFLVNLYAPDYGRALSINRTYEVEQLAPSVSYRSVYDADSGAYVDPQQVQAWLPPESSLVPVPISCQVRAVLDAWYEEVEGATATFYELDFEAQYLMRQETSVPTSTVEIAFSFPTGLDTLNDVYFFVDGEVPDGVQYSLSGIVWSTEIVPGEEHEVTVTYRAHGTGSFRYTIDHNRRLEELDVQIAVNGLTGSTVTDDSLSTTEVSATEEGELFTWGYKALIADRDLEVTLPTPYTFAQRVQDLQGPLRDLSLATPFLVGLFVLCLYGVSRLNDMRLAVHHYVLAGLAIFLFFPGLTFLSAVVELPVAVAVAATAVAGLLVVFLGLAVGWRRTALQAFLLSAVVLGLFSVGFISSARGLLFTAGGLALVADFMLLSATRRTSGEQATALPQAPNAVDEVDRAKA